MKKILLAIAAVGTLAAALPAAAAPFAPGGYGDVGQRIQAIQVRIDRGAQDRSLSFREVHNLRAQVENVRRLEVRYGRDGLNGRERADLNARLDRISFQVRGDRHDGDRHDGDRHDGDRRW